MSEKFKQRMAARRANPQIADRLLAASQAYRAEALKSVRHLSGEARSAADAEIEKVALEIAAGRRAVEFVDGRVVIKPQ